MVSCKGERCFCISQNMAFTLCRSLTILLRYEPPTNFNLMGFDTSVRAIRSQNSGLDIYPSPVHPLRRRENIFPSIPSSHLLVNFGARSTHVTVWDAMPGKRDQNILLSSTKLCYFSLSNCV